MTKFLERSNDTTVTKFLDHAVAAFLDQNDVTVTKFLNAQDNDETVAKYLEDTVITNFLQTDEIPTKYLEYNAIKYLGCAAARFLESNDVTVTKFLETALANFLLDDRLVSKFLEENDITVTKFLLQ